MTRPAKAYDDATARNDILTQLIEERGWDSADAVVRALRDPDAGVRQIALSNLDLAASDPRASPALRREMETAALPTRWLAVRAMVMTPAAMVGMRDQVAMCAADPDPLIRRALLANVASGPGVDAIARPILMAALLGSDPGDRMAAAQSWARLRLALPTAVRDRLEADLGDRDIVTAGAAAFALNTLWDGNIEERCGR